MEVIRLSFVTYNVYHNKVSILIQIVKVTKYFDYELNYECDYISDFDQYISLNLSYSYFEDNNYLFQTNDFIECVEKLLKLIQDSNKVKQARRLEL